MTLRCATRALAACALTLTGCASTTLRSGKPPGEVPAGYDERWHPSFLFGLVPLHESYDLSQICRGGWAEVRVSADPFTALSGLLTLFVYSPSRLTVVCAARERAAPPALREYPAPTFSKRPTANAKLAP